MGPTNALFLARYARHAPTSKVLRPTFRAYAPRRYAQIGPTKRNEPQHETTTQQEPEDGWTSNGTRTHDGPHDAPRHDAHWPHPTPVNALTSSTPRACVTLLRLRLVCPK